MSDKRVGVRRLSDGYDWSGLHGGSPSPGLFGDETIPLSDNPWYRRHQEDVHPVPERYCHVCADILAEPKRLAQRELEKADAAAMLHCLLRDPSVRGVDTDRIPLHDRPCYLCGKPVRDKTKVYQGRRLRWCSDACVNLWVINHSWTSARHAAIRRDEGRCNQCGRVGGTIREDACETCGPGWPCLVVREADPNIVTYPSYNWQHRQVSYLIELEVNHIVPRLGAGYHEGCHHHLDLLETLCHTCHVRVTSEQARARRPSIDQVPLFADESAG